MDARDWVAVADRLGRDVERGDELVPVGRLRRYAAGAGPSALVRWIVSGKRGVRMDGTRGPGKTWLSTRSAVIRFFAALSAVEAGRQSPPDPPDRQTEWALGELRKLGLKV